MEVHLSGKEQILRWQKMPVRLLVKAMSIPQDTANITGPLALFEGTMAFLGLPASRLGVATRPSGPACLQSFDQAD